MPNFDEYAVTGMASRSFPITTRMLTREFALAWLMALAAVAVLPAIFLFGIAADIVRRMTPRKKQGAIVIEGKYRVVS